MATTYRTPVLKSRREYFRLPYPVTTGAVLAMGGTNYKVEEVSERGLRLSAGPGQLPVRTPVQGTLLLTAGLRCTVSGTVLRVDEHGVVVLLDKGPTCYDVIREQRHLAKTYPEWKPQPA